jgi:hypothetical protein
MVLFTFLFASFLGLVIGGSSRYLGFGRNWVAPAHSQSRWLVFALIVLWVAAPFYELMLFVCCLIMFGLEDVEFSDETVQSLGIALGLLQGGIAFAIAWLAGPEADRAYRPRNPFEEDVPPVFLFPPDKDDDNDWFDVLLDKQEAAQAAGSR